MKRMVAALLSRVLAFFSLTARRSHERRKKSIADFLLSLPNGAKVIDVGAGLSPYREYASHLSYTSHDLGEYDGVGDSLGFQSGSWQPGRVDITSDITSIPVSCDHFDAAICTDVLEHVPDAPAAVREIDRIVRKDGHILITSPVQADAHQSPYFFSGGYHDNFYHYCFPNRPVRIEHESGYFETTDQKIYLTILMLLRLVHDRRRYAVALALYLLVAWPLVAILRMLPRNFDGFTATNGLFVRVGPPLTSGRHDDPATCEA